VRHGTLAISIYDAQESTGNPAVLTAASAPYDIMIPIPKSSDLSRDHPVGFSTFGDAPTADFDILALERYSRIERRP
jgi:hypothetical protein